MMIEPLRIAMVDPEDQSRELLRQLLEGMSDLVLESECSRYELFVSLVEQTEPDIAIINLDTDIEKSLLVIQQINRESPATSILVSSSNTDGQLILRVIRAGAQEYLTVPINSVRLSPQCMSVRDVTISSRSSMVASVRASNRSPCLASAIGALGLPGRRASAT